MKRSAIKSGSRAKSVLTRNVVVKFDEHDADAWLDLKLSGPVLKSEAFSDAIEALSATDIIDQETANEVTEGFLATFATAIEGWNYTDEDGTPIEVSAEALLDLDEDEREIFLVAMFEALNDPKANETSTGSAPSKSATTRPRPKSRN